MAITYTWNVVQMDAYPEKDGLTDIVFTVHWTLNGDDGEGHTGSAYGSVGVTLDEDGDYTPYDKLTQEQVVGWVKNSLGDEQVASLETSIANQIEQQIKPTVVTPPLPWAA
jgi:carbon monoxide dehydrogenase subunit G